MSKHEVPPLSAAEWAAFEDELADRAWELAHAPADDLRDLALGPPRAEVPVLSGVVQWGR